MTRRKTPPPVGGTPILDAFQIWRETNNPDVRLKDFARQLGLDATTLSHYIHQKRQIPLRVITNICRILYPHDPVRQAELKSQLKRPRSRTNSAPTADVGVYALQYGHLTVKEHLEPPTSRSAFSGPTGLLIRFFQRFADFAGDPKLRPATERVELKHTIDYRTPHSVILGNIATVDRLSRSYFFCTPINISVQGLIAVTPADSMEHALIKTLREVLIGEGSASAKGTMRSSQIAPIYMEGEIGSFIARTHLNGRRSAAYIKELSVERYVHALTNSTVADLRRRVILSDELTCLLTLKECRSSRVDVTLAFPDPENMKVPRFPFGFSVARQEEPLIKWLKAAWQLYLQADASYICDQYLHTYYELVEFVDQLEDCYGKTYYADKSEDWAARVMGLDRPDIPSTLVSHAWAPIIAYLFRSINR